MKNTIITCTLVGALAAGCGDSGPGGGNGDGKNSSVEEVLDDLGVVRSSEPRVDETGEPLPEDYAPLGGTKTINRFAEVLFFGAQLDDGVASQGRMPILDIDPGSNNSFSWSLLSDAPPADTPWMTANNDLPRAAVNGDFDRDGQDEIAIVYQVPTEPVRLVIMDGAPSYAFGEPQVIDTKTWDEIFIEAGDFDGNGSADLVVGLIDDATATLITLVNDDAGFRVEGSPRRITRQGTGGAQLAMASGNLDRDIALELAVVLNFDGEAARYFVYDDAWNDYAELTSDIAALRVGDSVQTAAVADVALGDVDGDGVDELVIAGLNRTGTVRQDAVRYFTEVMDDARTGFAHLTGNDVDSGAGRLQPTSSGAGHELSYLHVLTADVDGDGVKEIVTNQFLYEDLQQSGGVLAPLDLGEGPVEIPVKDLFTDGDSGDDYAFTWRSSAMAAGDVTSDRRENIVLYAQRLSVNGEGQELQVWGIDGIDGWKEMLDLETTFSNPRNQGDSIRPQIILTDSEVDNESMALEYSEGSYRFVFTEPLLLAALAAPPCSTELGQNVGSSCTTAFGRAISETVQRENSWSVIAGASVGFEADIPFVGGAEAIVDTQTTVRNTTTNAYTLTTSVIRETGSLEDSVIFTTVPLDIYTYTVLSHPNPDLVGENIEIRLPREPITIMAEIDVYNAALEEDSGVQIDDAIFAHLAGDPSTYPTRAEKNGLLNRWDGLQSDEVDVGQGTGQTIVSISDFSSTTRGTAYDFEASLNVKVTAGGAVAGYKVGGGVGAALEVSRGEETIYQGAVGNISAEFFPREAYSWGLFSYIYEDRGSGQTFEVLNYWVEQPE